MSTRRLVEAKQCAECGEYFHPWRRTTRYCSCKCAKVRLTAPRRLCPCGKPVLRGDKRRRFCTRSCWRESLCDGRMARFADEGRRVYTERRYRAAVLDFADLARDHPIFQWDVIAERTGLHKHDSALRRLLRARAMLGIEVPWDRDAKAFNFTPKDRALLERLEAAVLRTLDEEDARAGRK